MFTAGFQWDCTVGSKLTRLAGDLGNQIGDGFRYGDSLTSAAHFKAVFAGTFHQGANMRQRHGRTDGAALTFYLWAFALERATPTRVAISVTVNPITASIVGALLLHEPLSWNLLAGIATVFIGLAIATTTARPALRLAPQRTEPNIRQ